VSLPRHRRRLALRDVMYTFAAPAWRNLLAALELIEVIWTGELTQTRHAVQGLLNLPSQLPPFLEEKIFGKSFSSVS